MRGSSAPRDTAVRDLLHDLDDGDRLRANPLTAPHFEDGPAGEMLCAATLDRVRTTILAAVERLKSGAVGPHAQHYARHHAIVVRCDLGSESHKHVAADLGLSLRHFYRERKIAHRRLGELLARELRTVESAEPSACETSPAATTIERSDFALAQALAFREARRLDEAIVILQTLAAEAPSPARAVDFVATASEWLTDAYRLDAAKASLESGRAYAASLDGDERARARARIDVACAALHWARGETHASHLLSTRGLRVLRDRRAPGERPATIAYVHALLRHAANEDDLGNLTSALRALDEAGEFLTLLDPLPNEIRIRHLSLLGLLQAELYGSSAAASVTIGRALNCMRAGTFSGQTVLAIVASSIHTEMNDRDPARALGMLYECLPFAERSCLPVDLGMLYKRIAEGEALQGNGAVAKRYATLARDVFPGGSLGWIDAHCFEATADLAERDYANAVKTASTAVSGARRMRNHRRLGCGLRLLAQAYAGLNRMPESIDAIDEAIALLEGHTHSRALYLAYRFSAQVTGNARHKRLARELSCA